MVEKTRHEPGSFCWVELATSDASAAKSFYTSLFGWSVDEHPMGEGATYTMLQKNGKEVGALYPLGPQQKGVPPHWNSYVCVENADDAAARAKKLGAQVVMEPFDVKDYGRMAVVQDPPGAIFSLWQPGAHIGARVVYFSVDDCDEAVDRGKGLGAKVTMPPMEIETAGRFAVLSDPQGAGFAVIKLKAA